MGPEDFDDSDALMGPEIDDLDTYNTNEREDYDDEGDDVEYGDLGDDDEPIDGVGFADPGGRSALRAATSSNPRNLPCPTCGSANRLTPFDRARGYQCDACADRAETGGW